MKLLDNYLLAEKELRDHFGFSEVFGDLRVSDERSRYWRAYYKGEEKEGGRLILRVCARKDYLIGGHNNFPLAMREYRASSHYHNPKCTRYNIDDIVLKGVNPGSEYTMFCGFSDHCVIVRNENEVTAETELPFNPGTLPR